MKIFFIFFCITTLIKLKSRRINYSINKIIKMLNYLQMDKIILFCIYSYFIYVLLRILYWIYKITLRKRKDHLSNYGKDSWVLITGASEGIGKTFAEEFSKLGFNILLVSRDKDKLSKCKESIKQISKTSKIEWISFDFSKIELKQYQKYFIEIFSKYDISILINNVGVREVQNFNEFTLDQVYNMSVINVVPQVVLTRMLIDKFIERKKR